tara:strand:+ start:22 stop:381 length:360 start_codon:yes stop_codon:yes gene_type:complete
MAKLNGWKPVFIEALRNSGNVRASCHAAGITRQAAYSARAKMPTFAKAWDDALADAVDVLEATAWKRARDYSDGLVKFLLKAHRRDLYGDHMRQEISGKDGGAIEVVVSWDSVDGSEDN